MELLVNLLKIEFTIPLLAKYPCILVNMMHWSNSAVDLTQKKGELRKNLKKADFGIIRKQIFHRITYPKSSKILLGETYLCLI